MEKEIKKYSFKPGMPQEFEIIDIEELYQEAKEKLTKPHRTYFYHILWFKSGNFTHLVDFKPIKIESNSILFLDKETVQRFDRVEKYIGKAILFTDSFFCKTESDTKYLINNILFNNLFSVPQVNSQKSAAIFDALLDLMKLEVANQKDLLQVDILKNLLHNFLLVAEREMRHQNFTEVKKGTDFDFAMLFKQLLDAKYREQKRVNSYATALNITEKRLNLATSTTLDKSPKQLIDERIMLEAKRLLAHTTESAKEIGFYLGFEEPTNFTKYFRKHSNTTPVEFRAQFILA